MCFHEFVFSFFFLIQFDCTFEKNFLGSFLRHFTGNDLSTHSQSIIVSMSFVLPWGCTVFITPIVQQIGLHKTLQNLFKFRILFSIFGVMFGILSGRTHWCFLLINRVSSEIVCRLIPLIIAQLSDEDIFLNDRSTSGSLRASVFGAANVVGKIGQSAAPMFGYMLLSHHHNTYNDVQISDKENNSILIPILVAAVPLCIVVSQQILWNKISLKGDYLKSISTFVRNQSNRGQHVA